MSDGTMTFKRDVIYTATRGGSSLIVEFLVCGHCEARLQVIYEMDKEGKLKDHAHTYCPRCRVTYCDNGCPA